MWSKGPFERRKAARGRRTAAFAGARCRWRVRMALALPIMMQVLAPPARADAPLNYLFGAGPRNVWILTWGVLIVSLIVVVIITAILLLGIFKEKSQPPEVAPGKRQPISRVGNPIPIIYMGLIVSTVVLLGVTIWTMMTLADIAAPPRKPKITVEVIGHQWWWEFRYVGKDASQFFTTANEIHIPVAEPVALKLRSADVIHSFWVPALSGKTDLIPGQTNTTWILADQPGKYRGQCTEYCGLQHAHMGLEVIATSKDEFDAWRRDQLKPASELSLASAGQRVFMQKCAVCHSINGTRAGGRVGPDLTHLMTRTTIAAGTLPNRIGYLSGWIADPQHVKPGSKMPRLQIDGKDLAQVRDYLETLN
jgi:cytochrome c oxidase subunit II